MANKLSSLAKTLKKNSKGYNYKYTDLAGIHEALAEAGISYWQEVTQVEGRDFIKTHVIDDETGEEIRSGLGSEIVKVEEINGKVNAPQALGASISYSRRYSLLLILGLATEDDDAESLTQSKQSNRLDFDKIKETLKTITTPEAISAYAQSIASSFPNMTDAQRTAIGRIFDSRRKELHG